MLENFQLAAIVKTDGEMRLLRIPLHQGLQAILAKRWGEQYAEFLSHITEVDFDAGYNPEKHERFRLNKYNLPEWIKKESSLTVQHLDTINTNDEFIDSIKAIVAFARSGPGQEVTLFQKFSRSHVIKPGSFLLLQNDTYETVRGLGLRSTTN